MLLKILWESNFTNLNQEENAKESEITKETKKQSSNQTISIHHREGRKKERVEEEGIHSEGSRVAF